jgi:hypothetical protein
VLFGVLLGAPDAEAARRLSAIVTRFGEIIRSSLNNLSQPVNITKARRHRADRSVRIGDFSFANGRNPRARIQRAVKYLLLCLLVV